MTAQEKLKTDGFRDIMKLTKEEKLELLDIWKAHISGRKEGYQNVDERRDHSGDH